MSSRTVIVLNRKTSFFDFISSEVVQMDIRAEHKIEIKKTAWTCALEGVLEYCKIAFELFPYKSPLDPFHQVSVFVTFNKGIQLNGWSHEKQNIKELSESLEQMHSNNLLHSNQQESADFESLSPQLESTLAESLDSLFMDSSGKKKTSLQLRIVVVEFHQNSNPDINIQEITLLSRISSYLEKMNNIAKKDFEVVSVKLRSNHDELKFYSENMDDIRLQKVNCKVEESITVFKELAMRHFGVKQVCIKGIPLKECEKEIFLMTKDDKTETNSINLTWVGFQSKSTTLVSRIRPTGFFQPSHKMLKAITKILDSNDVILQQDTSSKPDHILILNQGELSLCTIRRSILSDNKAINIDINSHSLRTMEFGEMMKKSILKENRQLSIHSTQSHFKKFFVLSSETSVVCKIEAQSQNAKSRESLSQFRSILEKTTVDELDLVSVEKILNDLLGLQNERDRSNLGYDPSSLYRELRFMVELRILISDSHNQILKKMMSIDPKKRDAKQQKQKKQTILLSSQTPNITGTSHLDLANFDKMTEREKKDFENSDFNNSHGITSSYHEKKGYLESSTLKTKEESLGNVESLFYKYWTSSKARKKPKIDFSGRSQETD